MKTVPLDPITPPVREPTKDRQPPTEKNYGWHHIPIVRYLGERRFQTLKGIYSKCVCGRKARAISANHTDPQELFHACRHCCHTFYSTNRTGKRL